MCQAFGFTAASGLVWYADAMAFLWWLFPGLPDFKCDPSFAGFSSKAAIAASGCLSRSSMRACLRSKHLLFGGEILNNLIARLVRHGVPFSCQSGEFRAILHPFAHFGPQAESGGVSCDRESLACFRRSTPRRGRAGRHLAGRSPEDSVTCHLCRLATSCSTARVSGPIPAMGAAVSVSGETFVDLQSHVEHHRTS